MDPFTCIEVITEDICKVTEDVEKSLSEWLKKNEEVYKEHCSLVEDLEAQKRRVNKETQEFNEELDMPLDAMIEKINNDKKLVELEQDCVEKLKKENSLYNKEIDKNFKLTRALKKKGEPTLQDSQMLEKAKMKYYLYKDTSGMKFDYTETDHLQVYIKSKDNSGLKTFRFKGSTPVEEIEEKLWDQLATLTLTNN